MDDFIRAKRVLVYELEEAGGSIATVDTDRVNEQFSVVLSETPDKQLLAIIPPAFSKEESFPDGITLSIDWKLFNRYYSKNYDDSDFC